VLKISITLQNFLKFKANGFSLKFCVLNGNFWTDIDFKFDMHAYINNADMIL